MPAEAEYPLILKPNKPHNRVWHKRAKKLRRCKYVLAFYAFFGEEGNVLTDILSVGIDIGTSTTQLVFSRISMENMSGYFCVPRICIVHKQVIYKSKVHITPLSGPVLIDGEAIREIVAEEFRHQFIVSKINEMLVIRPAFFFDIHSDMESRRSDLRTSEKSGLREYRSRTVPVLRRGW